jgi:hypothetical protein
MARFISDYNKVVGIHESGTYAVQETGAVGAAGSTFWIGQVTENSIENAQNHIETKYMGTASRSFDSIILGPNDVTGTLTYHPHDMRLMFFAIGSIVEVSGATLTTATHGVTQINSDVWQSPFTSGTNQQTAPMSFTIEDSKQSPGTGRNFIRTVNGAVVNTATLTLTQGEKAVMEIAYIGQSEKFSSGTTTILINSGTSALTPYLWANASLTLAGSVMDTAKEISFEVNNNIEAPHYINGSRVIGVPYAGNREYTLNVTADLDGTNASFLYEQYYLGGSSFNGTLDLNADVTAIGSKHTIFYLSGCKITGMDNPSTAEGTTETAIEIRPQNVTGSVFDKTHKYCPW